MHQRIQRSLFIVITINGYRSCIVIEKSIYQLDVRSSFLLRQSLPTIWGSSAVLPVLTFHTSYGLPNLLYQPPSFVSHRTISFSVLLLNFYLFRHFLLTSYCYRRREVTDTSFLTISIYSFSYFGITFLHYTDRVFVSHFILL